MPIPALVTVRYKTKTISCYNKQDGNLCHLGLNIISDIDRISDINSGEDQSSLLLEWSISNLNNHQIVRIGDKPTPAQKEALQPYTHIYLPTQTEDSWEALHYGTQGGIKNMIDAGISINKEDLPNTRIHYEVDLYAQTVTAIVDGEKATYPFTKTNEAYNAWRQDKLWVTTGDDENLGYEDPLPPAVEPADYDEDDVPPPHMCHCNGGC